MIKFFKLYEFYENKTLYVLKAYLNWDTQLISDGVKVEPSFNSSPPGQNGRRFAANIFRCIFVNEKVCILIKTSLKFVPKGPIDNNAVLV